MENRWYARQATKAISTTTMLGAGVREHNDTRAGPLVSFRCAQYARHRRLAEKSSRKAAE